MTIRHGHRGRLPGAVLVLLAVVGSVPPALSGESADWPTYLGNNRRNAATDERLPPPLAEAWVHRAMHAPQPAWPPPANQNFYGGAFNLEPRSIHENAYQVTVAGDSLYYASPANHAVYCLDVETGKVRWRFFAEGPVRLAPTLWNNRAYFGSDDGRVYCVDASGKSAWELRIAPSDRRLPGNGHMISYWPVRSGVLIENGRGLACAGFFPGQGTYRCAFEPDSGNVIWRQSGGVYEGYLASTGDQILAPSGRTAPQAFSPVDGKGLGFRAPGAAGTYMVAIGKTVLCKADANYWSLAFAGTDYVHPAEFAVSREDLVWFHGRREVSAVRFDDFLAALRDKEPLVRSVREAQQAIKRIDKQKEPAAFAKAQADIEQMKQRITELDGKLADAVVWAKKTIPKDPKDPGVRSWSLLLAGDVLFSGRDGCVTALSAKDGTELWSGRVPGKVCGLAAARGRLFVSTDAGSIHCFVPREVKERQEVAVAARADAAPVNATTHEAVARILVNTADRKGYCLVLGDVDAGLLAELARTTEFRIVSVEPDADKAAALRSVLDDAGLYGRVAVQRVTSDKLPYPAYFATLVIVRGDPAAAPSEVCRVLQPYGGTAVKTGGASLKSWMNGLLPAGGEFAGETVLRRGPLPGAGEWTHQYAAPSNVATSGDPYVRGEVVPLWFGEPGPREIIDRHNRTMAPLFRNGRLFVPANERIIAVNPYNGVRLWDLDVPGSRRVGVLKDSGQMALGDDMVYIVVKDRCWGVDAATGKHETTLGIPGADAQDARSWGYLAVVGDRVLGTAEKPKASFGDHCNMCPILEGDFRPVVISEELFCLDRKTGGPKWRYRNGSILNSGIAVGAGSAFFLESRNERATSGDKTGRIRIDEFLKGGAFLVALDLDTGNKRWEQPVDLPYQHIVYLWCADGTVLSMGTYNRTVDVKGKPTPVARYGLHAFHAESGKPKWQYEVPTTIAIDGTHGEQWQHPVIIGDEIFTRYFACDLRTGSPLPEWTGGLSGGCGALAGSASAVFGRGGGIDLDSRRPIRLSQVNREGCFINLIPAGGVLSVPESSAGCTCGYPVQMSIGYAPVDGLSPVILPLHRKFTDKVTVTMTPRIDKYNIRYTLDGSDPTENSTLYAGPFELTESRTVKARLWGPSREASAAASAAFVRVVRAEPAAAGRGADEAEKPPAKTDNTGGK